MSRYNVNEFIHHFLKEADRKYFKLITNLGLKLLRMLTTLKLFRKIICD